MKTAEQLIAQLLASRPDLKEAVYSMEDFEVVKSKDIVEQIKKAILVRKGEVIDEKVALERARNIAAALMWQAIVS